MLILSPREKYRFVPGQQSSTISSSITGYNMIIWQRMSSKYWKWYRSTIMQSQWSRYAGLSQIVVSNSSTYLTNVCRWMENILRCEIDQRAMKCFILLRLTFTIFDIIASVVNFCMIASSCPLNVSPFIHGSLLFLSLQSPHVEWLLNWWGIIDSRLSSYPIHRPHYLSLHKQSSHPTWTPSLWRILLFEVYQWRVVTWLTSLHFVISPKSPSLSLK